MWGLETVIRYCSSNSSVTKQQGVTGIISLVKQEPSSKKY